MTPALTSPGSTSTLWCPLPGLEGGWQEQCCAKTGLALILLAPAVTSSQVGTMLPGVTAGAVTAAQLPAWYGSYSTREWVGSEFFWDVRASLSSISEQKEG